MKKVIATTNAPAAIGPYSQAIQAGNLLFASGQFLAEAGFEMTDVVKTTVYLADMQDFAIVNEIYATQFTAPFPARSAVAVKTLPKGGLVG